MTKTRPLKNPQDEPMPNLRCEEEIYLRPVGFFSKFFDDGIELPCYPSNFHLIPCPSGGLYLGPGPALREDDWLTCAPTFPACRDWDY